MPKRPAEPDPDGRGNAAEASPPFTADSARALFVEVLRRERPPTSGACGEVARRLNALHLVARMRSNPPPHDAASRAAAAAWEAKTFGGFLAMRKALKQLHVASPRFEQSVRRFAEGTEDEPIRAFERGALDALRDLRAAARVLSQYAGPQPGRQKKAWHSDAAELLEVFRLAMRSSEQATEFEPSEDGPAARFIQRALALTSGINVTLPAIDKALSRRKPGQ